IRTRSFSRSTWRLGLGACSLISSAPRRRTFTATSVRSAAFSWKSKRKLLRSPRERNRDQRRKCDDNERQDGGGPSRFPSRVRRRCDRRCKRAARRGSCARRYREQRRETQVALQRERPHQGVLPHQTLSELREPPVLTKKSDRQVRRGNLAGALTAQSRGLDRRTFLRRSGIAAGGLAALGRVAPPNEST